MRREPDPSDWRGTLVVLTEQGLELADAVLTAHFEEATSCWIACPLRSAFGGQEPAARSCCNWKTLPATRPANLRLTSAAGEHHIENVIDSIPPYFP